ncbi:TadG family pilus assembly protein [Pseudomonas sp. NPDC090202]|uniref:TadG family pilus assembly protein n=1 Tax=unclassified Pseudomonas TaxID=196821 RepID=UPI0038158831
MSPPIHRGLRRDRQRGAIGLLAALTMALALLCTLVVVDSGRLYLEKRTLQRVADMAALEAASLNGSCSGANTASSYATQSATRNGFTVSDNSRTLTTRCGTLATGADSRRSFVVDATQSAAIQVTVSHAVPRSIAAGVGAMFDSQPTSPNVQLTAVAVAAKPSPPLAQLTIRSTLATVDSNSGNLLNSIWGGLLGGTLNISVAGWNGLTNANINLLNFLNQLALDVGVKAGDYTSLLGTSISVTQLLNTSTKVLSQNSPAIQAAINNLLGVNAIAAGTKIKLQDLLTLQSGLPASALDTNLNLFQLIEAFVQVANTQSAAFATIPANVLGLAGVTINLKVIEPPQLSAMGNPVLAKANPTGPNQIYVRTAQVRTLISVDLSGLNASLGAVNGLLSILTGALSIDPKLLPNGPNLDLSLEAASASSRVTDFDCTNDSTKSLTATTSTAAVTVKVGQINKSAWTSSSTNLTVSELPILDLGLVSCNIFGVCQPRIPYGAGGVGLMIGGTGPLDGTVLGSVQPWTFPQPAEINQPPSPYHSFSSNNLVSSLQNTLGSIKLINHPPASTSLLGAVLGLVTGVLTSVLNLLGGVVGGLLGPIVDPLLNQVLTSLGINLANVEVGANLSCHPGQAQLVI